MKDLIYIDNAATTKVSDAVLEEMIPYFQKYYGNPSGMYFLAEHSKLAIDYARQRTAKAINARSNEIYFVSGGSEADNLAIKGVARAYKKRGNHIITTKIEHSAVLKSMETLEKEGFEVTYLDVDKNGMIDINMLKQSIKRNTILISIMFANNEIGTIQPIEEIGMIARRNNIIFHTDAVQAIGNIKIDVARYNIDLLSMSGHKIYAPKGVGALYVRQGVNIERIIDGGSQENGLRAGTENVVSIVGFGKAIEEDDKNLAFNIQKLITLRDMFARELIKVLPDIKINGDLKYRLPGNMSISFNTIQSKTMIEQLSNKRICVSGGSACSAKNPKPSHVLTAIGLDSKTANSTIRFTFGLENDAEDMIYTVNQIVEIMKYK